MIATLTGQNDSARQAEAKRLIERFVAQYSDMALERVDGEEATYERMHEAVQGAPFLSERKLVVLRRPSANKEFLEKFMDLQEDVAETNDVIIIEPKLDKRLAYYKQLKKFTEFKEFPVLDANGLAQFAVQYTQKHAGTLSMADARRLVERIGSNQLVVQNELDKLIDRNPQVDAASIDLLTEPTPQSSIFDLLDSAFAGNSTRAMTLYKEQRVLRVEPQQIIAMCIWQLHILAIVKTAGSRTADDIAREAKISPFTVRKTLSLTQRVSYLQLKAQIAQLRDFDVRLKTESLNADEVVQYYLMTLGNTETIA